MSEVKLRLDILTAHQLRLWPSLNEVPSHFTLYGGTAIALQLGHRQSVDFDFFTPENFDPDRLYSTLSFLNGAQVTQKDRDTLTCLTQESVKVSFFGGLDFPLLRPKISTPVVPIASLLDLSGMKVAVIQKRAELKDYLDIAALLQHGISLKDALDAGRKIYGAQFNPLITLKALTYYEEGDVRELPKDIQQYLTNAVKNIDLRDLEGG